MSTILDSDDHICLEALESVEKFFDQHPNKLKCGQICRVIEGTAREHAEEGMIFGCNRGASRRIREGLNQSAETAKIALMLVLMRMVRRQTAAVELQCHVDGTKLTV